MPERQVDRLFPRLIPAAGCGLQRVFDGAQVLPGADLVEGGGHLGDLGKKALLVLRADGLPLAIELAAAWVRTLTLAEIVQEMERSLDFLNASLRDLPERHRSLRAVFDASWQQLTVDEQVLLAQLSVFRGSFTVEAWVQPSASPGFESYVLGHGYDIDISSTLSPMEDVLRIENGNYQAGCYDGANHNASFAVPAGDLGTSGWVYLAGTYDGANWNLYRDGGLVASTADATGAVMVSHAAWAIGARGGGSRGPSRRSGAARSRRSSSAHRSRPGTAAAAATRGSRRCGAG